MKTENKLKELKIEAWDTHNAEVEANAAWDDALEIYEHAATVRDAAYATYTDAENSRESALAIYMNTGKALTTAHHAAQQAANIANAYEVGGYETNNNKED